MGTRGLLGVILRSGRRKASYNHWDSYPAGLGKEIAKFTKSLSDAQVDEMAEKYEEITWVDERTPAPKDLQVKYGSAGFANLAVANRSSANWYCLIHKTQGAEALPHILNGTLKHQIDCTEFSDDELSCEWAYWIDWNKRKLYVEQKMTAEVEFKELSEKWMEELDKEYKKQLDIEEED